MLAPTKTVGASPHPHRIPSRCQQKRPPFGWSFLLSFRSLHFIMDRRPHPYRVCPSFHGFSPGLKKCPPDTFLPRLRRGRPLRNDPVLARMRDSICIGIREWMPIIVLPPSSRRQATVRRTVAFKSFESQSRSQNNPAPTPLRGAFAGSWILPRPKKVSTGHFFAPPAAGPASSNPQPMPTKKTTLWVVFFVGRG